MNATLWVIAAALAMVYLAAGSMKLIQPKAQFVASGQAWAEDLPAGALKAIGSLEVLGVIGLIVPPLVDVAVDLAPLAASGFALLAAGGVVTHARRRELPNIGVNLVLLGLALFVAILRFGEYSF
jgi:hypothetical protein